MTDEMPKVALTGRYNQKETAKALGVSRDSILRYVNAGELNPGFHRHSKRRFYEGREIIRFWKSRL